MPSKLSYIIQVIVYHQSYRIPSKLSYIIKVIIFHQGYRISSKLSYIIKVIVLTHRLVVFEHESHESGRNFEILVLNKMTQQNLLSP